MMKMNGSWLRGPLLALVMSPVACDDGGAEQDEAATDNDDAASDVTDRELCLYPSPQGTDDTATLVGRPGEVESSGEADAFPCDLHMFKVAAAPPSARARTVVFQGSSYDGFSHTGARLWTRNCTGGVCSDFDAVPVTLTVTEGHCINPDINEDICFPSLVYGEVTLPGNNNITDVRAGMRVLDDDGDSKEVTITVSE
jgi:hypothetical protein